MSTGQSILNFPPKHTQYILTHDPLFRMDKGLLLFVGDKHEVTPEHVCVVTGLKKTPPNKGLNKGKF